MNVVVLIASLGGGGAERMAIRLSEGLTRIGMNSFLVTLDNSRDYNTEPSSVLAPSKTNWPTLIKTLFMPWQINRFEGFLKNNKIDVVISFLERANIINLIQKTVPCRIISVRTHSTKMMSAKSPLKRKLVSMGYNKLLFRAASIVCNSHEMRDDFNSLYETDPKRLDVIYNFINMKQIKQAASEKLPPIDERMFRDRVIITAGRLTTQKGQWHLIRAFKKISEKNDNVKLIILGKGELMDTMKKMCLNLGISEKVFFPGFVKNPAKYIARADIFAFPSLWEGFPNALLEAMAIGIPVISTDCSSGPRELMIAGSLPEKKTRILEKTEFGILIPPLDGKIRENSIKLNPGENNLSDGIIHMLSDSSYMNSCKKNVLKRAQEFSEESVIKQWAQKIIEAKYDVDQCYLC